jgi:nitrite reductase/ring-hydroxylating ferredoxin subunit
VSAGGTQSRVAHDVCAYDELAQGVVHEVRIRAGRSAAAVRYGDGGVRVFAAVCPHRGGPLSKGRVRQAVTAPAACPVDRIVDPERMVLTCPWHNWEFDLADGRALYDDRGIRLYDSAVVEGRVVVYLPA